MYTFCDLFKCIFPCWEHQMNRIWGFIKPKKKKPEKVPLLKEDRSGYTDETSPTKEISQVQQIKLDINNQKVRYRRSAHSSGSNWANQINQVENNAGRGCKINQALEMVERDFDYIQSRTTEVNQNRTSDPKTQSIDLNQNIENSCPNRTVCSSAFSQTSAVMQDYKNTSVASQETTKTIPIAERNFLINQCTAARDDSVTSRPMTSSEDDLTWDAYVPPLQLRWSDVVIKQIFDVLETDNEAYIRHIRRLTTRRDMNPINILQKLCWFDEETNTVQALVGVFEYDL
ncbi:uncharacterized protein LOC100178973 isoform X2 [Ciona intestinalis]